MLVTASEVGIHPEEFWRLTLREFYLVLEGEGRRMERDMRLRAWEACHQLNMWSKTPITPDDLLGTASSSAQPIIEDAAEWQAYMRSQELDKSRERARARRGLT